MSIANWLSQSAWRFCAVLLALALYAPFDSLAADVSVPDADEIVANVNARDDGHEVSRKLTMTLTDRRGKQRIRETFGYRKYYGDEKRSVIFYLSPTNIRDTSFLTYDYPETQGDDDQWLYLPAARKVRRISSADRGDYFLGTDFTYEDMKKEGRFSVEDYNYTTAGSEEIDGHLCYIVEAVPVDEKTAKELGYSRIRSWIDAALWMLRKAECWDIKGNPLKIVHNQDIREIDGIWTAHAITAKNHKTGHTSQFIFTEVDYNATVEDDVFTERAMRRGVRGN